MTLFVLMIMMQLNRVGAVTVMVSVMVSVLPIIRVVRIRRMAEHRDYICHADVHVRLQHSGVEGSVERACSGNGQRQAQTVHLQHASLVRDER